MRAAEHVITTLQSSVTTGTACRQRYVNSAGVGRQFYGNISDETVFEAGPVTQTLAVRVSTVSTIGTWPWFLINSLSRRGVGEKLKIFAFSRCSTTVSSMCCFVRFFYGYATITLNMWRKPTARRVKIRFKLTETDTVRTAPVHGVIWWIWS